MHLLFYVVDIIYFNKEILMWHLAPGTLLNTLQIKKFSHNNPVGVGTLLIPIGQMKKLRSREMKSPARSQTASKWENPDRLTPASLFLATQPCSHSYNLMTYLSLLAPLEVNYFIILSLAY